MSSIQERLQLKRVPLDTWNIREQLCLASAVVRSGDQNWMSVSRALKTVGESNRPPDWYSQKSCAAQYGALLEHVETPKRKKRSSEGAVETPQESILKKLTQERIVEIQKTLAEMNQQYDHLKSEVLEVQKSSTSEDRLREIWSSIESRARAREREAARRAAWLRERDERRARSDRAWRPNNNNTTTPNNTAGSPGPPASPLLTSLLKSSPVVTTPQHISHPANVVDTMSPSVTAPTLSMLLEKCVASAAGAGSTGSTSSVASTCGAASKHAAIEHIKSQLVQIEHQLKASTPAPPPPAAPALDIDDIEIKAEDVYAFRDVDIHIPPVTAMHKPNARVLEKPVKMEDAESTPVVPDGETICQEELIIKEEPETISTENVEEEVLVDDTEPPPEVTADEPEAFEEPTPEAEVKIAFPEVKFPTTEIKVIQPEDQKIKEEIKELDIPLPPERVEEPEVPVQEPDQTVAEEISEPIPEPEVESKQEESVLEAPVEDAAAPAAVEDQLAAASPPPDICPTKEPDEQATEPLHDLVETPPLPPVEAAPVQEELPEQTIEEKLEMMEKEVVEETTRESERDSAQETSQEEPKPEVDEDSMPLKEMMKEECTLQVTEPEVKPEAGEGEDPHTETDDDTPMELSREEEKDGRKRKDYSRKKKSESRTWSGSESAEASAPESPHASDADRQHRLWKKSVMLVYSRLCAHKYASLFLRPISDEEAPGYSRAVRRPMDMTTIRKNIESGHIRTTEQFQREILLMLSNALMYNSSEHSVYTMARDMYKEAMCQLGMLLAAQAHAGLVEAAPATRKRRRPDSPKHADKRHH